MNTVLRSLMVLVRAVCAGAVLLSSVPAFAQSDGDLRLVNGSRPHEGRVEIYYSETWGNVCDDGWGMWDARVACRQLGFGPPTSAPTFSHFGAGLGPIWLDDLQCTSREDRLLDCPREDNIGVGVHNCGRREHAGVVCGGPSNMDLEVSEISSSIVEDSGVGGTFTVSLSEQPTENVTVAITPEHSAALTPSPATLTFTSTTWSAAQTVTVVATNDSNTVDDAPRLRLTPSGSGLAAVDAVLVRVPVVDDDTRLTAEFTNVPSTYAGSEVVNVDIEFSSPLPPTHWRNVFFQLTVTNGTLEMVSPVVEGEGSQWRARIRPSGSNDFPVFITLRGALECEYGYNAGLCSVSGQRMPHSISTQVNGGYAISLGQLRLRGGEQPWKGRVEVFYSSTFPQFGTRWGTVCSRGWDRRDAQVACRALGYSGAESAPRNAAFGRGSGQIWLDSLGCNGSESSLLDCRSARPIGDTRGRCVHSMDAGVACTPPTLDQASASLVLPDAAITVEEDLADGQSFRVSLGAQPTAPVTVAVSPSDASALSVSPSSLTFTAENWTTFQDVTVTALHDDDAIDNDGFSVSLSASAGGYDDVSGSIDVAVSDDDEPLLASLRDPPSTHSGSGAKVRVKLDFSRDPSLSYRDVRDSIAQVSGGRVLRARRLQRPTNLRWEITVRSTTDSDIVFTVQPDIPCDQSKAVCTSRGMRLSEGVSHVIRGPSSVESTTPTLSIFDAQAREGTDASVDFAVALLPASASDVVLTWTTTDGTATSGDDYTGGTSTLSIPAGATSATLSIPVLVDSRDEDDETFTITLTVPPSAAVIDDGVAIGTITNSGAIPGAWAGRFGKVAAGHVIDAVERRLTNPRPPHFEVAGHDLLSVFPDDSSRGWDAPEGDGTVLALDDVLRSGSFHLRSGDVERHVSTWGSAAFEAFDATDDGVDLDGKVRSLVLGSDITSGQWTAGAALSMSDGDGSYRVLDSTRAAPGSDGSIDARLTGLYPYGAWRFSGGASMWALVGAASGPLTVTEEASAGTRAYRTDMSLGTAAVGAQMPMVVPEEPSGWRLDALSSARWVRTRTDAVQGLGASSSDVGAIRAGVDATRFVQLASGSTLEPRLGLGLRHDMGAFDEGTGIEVDLGLSYALHRWSLDLGSRFLVAHDQSSLSQWGVTGSFDYAALPGNRGLSVSIAPSVGLPSSDDQPFTVPSADHVFVEGAEAVRPILRSEAAYGFSLRHGRGVLAPYAAYEASDSPPRLRLGTRWHIGHSNALSVEHASSAAGDDSVLLRASFGW